MADHILDIAGRTRAILYLYLSLCCPVLDVHIFITLLYFIRCTYIYHSVVMY